MAEQQESGGFSFQQILERQGLDPNAGPDDFRLERATPRMIGDERTRDWYAIPTEIFVTNPLTSEHETGTLAENGAFISRTVEIKNYKDLNTLDSRVMVLGKSVLQNVRIGSGTVINGATVKYARIGRNSVVDEGAIIQSSLTAPEHPRVGNNVRIGRGVSVSRSSAVYDRSRIGDGVWVVDSTVGFDVVAEATDRNDRTPLRNTFRGHRTFIGRSVIKDGVRIATNAQIEGSTVGKGAAIGLRADLEYVEVAENTVVPHDTKMIELHPDKKAAEASIEAAHNLEEDVLRKPLLRTRARMDRWWVANERAKLRAGRNSS